jgi:transposase
MTENNIVYLYDVCGLSFDVIALRYNVHVDVIREIVSKPKPYPLAYQPRNRYKGWVNGK